MGRWHWYEFERFTVSELYCVLQARQDVFVVEQNCIYQDLDGMDKYARHLCAWDKEKNSELTLLAYLRIFPPGIKFEQASIGRILTTKKGRGAGLGREAVKRAIATLRDDYPNTDIAISAQCYLDDFYRSFGFLPISSEYLEDGIPHQDMLLSSDAFD